MGFKVVGGVYLIYMVLKIWCGVDWLIVMDDL